MIAKLAALFAVTLMSSAALAGHTAEVRHVQAGRTVVPVVVTQDHAARPYALTGREQAAPKVHLVPVTVGSRVSGYQAR
ncbi:hypothetical protein [Humisphaera borealis]|uniref:Uncharacterized protein n=1 Tax=Humisphaera borealis TaxID=2807512 RepID=A0A7M2X0B2_9BACT|nr:hypothetical protein [Humisphaera borealis]QOV91113.1 hypothetical protein IPV69_07080 [Humisphaera borealis]